jgi:hypothetical protein
VDLPRRLDPADPAAWHRGQRANQRLYARWAGFDAPGRVGVASHRRTYSSTHFWSVVILASTALLPRTTLAERAGPLTGAVGDEKIERI